MPDPAPPTRPAAKFCVFLKDRDGEIPHDSSGSHWQPQGSAIMLPVAHTGQPSYVGSLTLPDGRALHFRAQPTRKTASPDHAALPDFNLFITDAHGNIYRIPRDGGGWTWRSFDGASLCDPGALWKAHRQTDHRMYLKGHFLYDGQRRYIQLWFDFRAKAARAASAP